LINIHHQGLFKIIEFSLNLFLLLSKTNEKKSFMTEYKNSVTRKTRFFSLDELTVNVRDMSIHNIFAFQLNYNQYLYKSDK